MTDDERYRKLCARKTLFRLKGDEEGHWRALRARFGPQMRASLVDHYGDRLEAILNESLQDVDGSPVDGNTPRR